MTNTTTYGNFQSTWNSILDTKSKPVVAVVGDSIAKKYNASSIATSWVGKMEADLQALKGNGGTGFRGMSDAYGATFGAAVLGDTYPLTDRVILSGSWTESNSSFPYLGPGHTMGATTTPGSSATFYVEGTHLKVFFLGIAGTGGVMSFTIDGVELPGRIDTGGKAITTPACSTIMSSASSGLHTVTVTLESGGLNLYGVSGEYASGAVVNNFSRPGLSALAALPGVNTGADWNGGVNYKADLIIYALGVNDLKSTDIHGTNVADHSRKFMSRLRETGVTAPVLVLANHPGSYDINDRQVAIDARLRELAEAYNGAFVNMWSKHKNSWAVADAANYWGSTAAIGVSGDEGVHPSNTGHADIWATLKPTIIQ